MALRQRLRPGCSSPPPGSTQPSWAIDVVAQHRIWNEAPLDPRWVLFVAGDWLLYALLTPAVFLLARRWPIARPHLLRRIALHVACSLLFCTAWAGVGTILKALIDPPSMEGGVGRQFISWLFITLPFGWRSIWRWWASNMPCAISRRRARTRCR